MLRIILIGIMFFVLVINQPMQCAPQQDLKTLINSLNSLSKEKLQEPELEKLLQETKPKIIGGSDEQHPWRLDAAYEVAVALASLKQENPELYDYVVKNIDEIKITGDDNNIIDPKSKTLYLTTDHWTEDPSDAIFTGIITASFGGEVEPALLYLDSKQVVRMIDLAGLITHMAMHSYLYNAYLLEHPGSPVPDEFYKGMKAEELCLLYQELAVKPFVDQGILGKEYLDSINEFRGYPRMFVEFEDDIDLPGFLILQRWDPNFADKLKNMRDEKGSACSAGECVGNNDGKCYSEGTHTLDDGDWECSQGKWTKVATGTYEQPTKELMDYYQKLYGKPTGQDGGGSCSPVGTWSWFNSVTVTINSDGTISATNGNTGTWELTDAQKKLFTLNWNNGQFIDSLTLSDDCDFLSGSNQYGGGVSGSRE